MSIDVPAVRVEEARARMIELFPAGFEEVEHAQSIELVAYTDWSGEEKLWQVFGASSSEPIAADWENAWRRFHRPVRVGHLWIGPPWERPDEGALAVVIDPGRAFGTGAHPTTRLCLELIGTLEPGSLLDVGCGSGVLAIAAVKLGFGPVTALDVDEAAIGATALNAAANGAEVRTLLLDAVDDTLPAADIVVANIAVDQVTAIGAKAAASYLVTSGYLDADEPELPAWRRLSRSRRDGWAADLYTRA